MNFKSILVRALSGAVYVGVILGCLFIGMPAMLCLVALLAILGSMEFSMMTSDRSQGSAVMMAADALCTLTLALGALGFTMWIWVFLLLLRCVLQLYIINPRPLRCLGLSFVQQLWIGLPLYLMTALGAIMDTFMYVMAVYIMIWLNDTGAFLVGSMLGKHRLFERLSPKKSWEGFFGGLFFVVAFSVVVALCCESTFGFTFGVLPWVCTGVIVVIFSTWGDLFESLIKRSLSLKDSGHLIPGHGGILDRIDSSLFVMPAIYLFYILIHNP